MFKKNYKNFCGKFSNWVVVGFPLKAFASLVKAPNQNKNKEVPVLSKSKQRKLKKLEVPVWSIMNLFLYSFFLNTYPRWFVLFLDSFSISPGGEAKEAVAS